MPEITEYTLLSRAQEIWDKNISQFSKEVETLLSTLYHFYKETFEEHSSKERWGIGRDEYEEAGSFQRMKPFKAPNDPVGEKMIWIFLLTRLYMLITNIFFSREIINQKPLLKKLIADEMEKLLDLLWQEIENKTLWHPDGILFIFSIELVKQTYREVEDNTEIGSSNTKILYQHAPIPGCSLIFLVTSTEVVFDKFIQLMKQVKRENRTWEMFFNALRSRKEIDLWDGSNVEKYTKELYALMKETPIITSETWLFTPYFHKPNFTYYKTYTKEFIFNQIKHLQREESTAFLRELFDNKSPQEDSLVIYMQKGGIFKSEYIALKYLRKLAELYVKLKMKKENYLPFSLNSIYPDMVDSLIIKQAQELANKENIVENIKRTPNLKRRLFYLREALDDKKNPLLYQFLAVQRRTINPLSSSQLEKIKEEIESVLSLLPVILALEETSMSPFMRKLLAYPGAGNARRVQKNIEGHIESLNAILDDDTSHLLENFFGSTKVSFQNLFASRKKHKRENEGVEMSEIHVASEERELTTRSTL